MISEVRAIALAGGLLSLSVVILAALGSHLIDMQGLQSIWQTALNIHMFNAAAILGLAALLGIRQSRVLLWGAWSVVSGTIIFSGSIYLHIITGQQLSGVAPAGGLLMMAGWVLVALSFVRKS
ncbi:MAG: DUF423 domain-containing protein [Xanthomonadales bacterium]|nr:DUF423 domain-containing protein [Xanthomonadales bacterium]